jgi:hypothetical protein
MSDSPTLIFDVPLAPDASPRPPNLKITQISGERRRDLLTEYAEDIQTDDQSPILLTPHALEIDGRPALEFATTRQVRHDLMGGGSATQPVIRHRFLIRDDGTDYECALTVQPDRYKKFSEEFRSICLSIHFVK